MTWSHEDRGVAGGGAVRAPGLRAPWITGLALFLVLAAAAGFYLSRPREDVPRSVLDARRDNTAAAARVVGRALGGGLSSLAEVATVVGESLRQGGGPLLVPFQHRRWLSLSLLDRTTDAVVAHVGEPSLPAVLGAGTGMSLTRVGPPRIVQYTPVGTRYVLAGQLDPAQLRELLAGDAWLLDRAGSVITGPGTGAPRAGSGAVGSTARRGDVIAWAAVAGVPFGWTVVSRQTTAVMTTPAGDHAVTLAVALAVLTAIVFGALDLLVLRPIRRLGHLTEQTATPRRGEAGHVAAALAHLRRRTE